MKNILTILIGLTFVACNNSAIDNKNISTSSDTITTVPVYSCTCLPTIPVYADPSFLRMLTHLIMDGYVLSKYILVC